MSHCRFRNTLNNLEDCVEALRQINEGTEEPLSYEEQRACEEMYEMSQIFIELYNNGKDNSDSAI